MAGATRDGYGAEEAGEVGRGLSVEGFVDHAKALGSRILAEEFHEGILNEHTGWKVWDGLDWIMLFVTVSLHYASF